MDKIYGKQDIFPMMGTFFWEFAVILKRNDYSNLSEYSNQSLRQLLSTIKRFVHIEIVEKKVMIEKVAKKIEISA